MICRQLFSCDATASAHSFEAGGVMKDVEVQELGDVGSTFTPRRQDRQNQPKFAYVGQIVLRLRIRPCVTNSRAR